MKACPEVTSTPSAEPSITPQIKCDVGVRPGGIDQPCMNCVQSKSDCRLRPSRRNVRFSSLAPHRGDVAPYHGSLPTQMSLDTSPNESHDTIEPPNPQATGHFAPRNSDHDSCANPQASYLGQSGYMPLLSDGQQMPNQRNSGPITIDIHYSINPLSLSLRKSYTEIVLRNCQTFCPALDQFLLSIPEMQNSLALQQAIGLIGSTFQPSLLYAENPATYYERAKILIQGGYEPNPLASLLTVMLFYWAAAAPPTIVSMNSVWWWMGVAVRQAQEIGLHRESRADRPLRVGESIGLQHRIWWTLFGRPCVINPQDCDVREPTPADFAHPEDCKTTIFIQWVQLCCIVGRVGDHLRRNPSSTQVAHGLLDELKSWAHALPEPLQLRLSAGVSPDFEPDLYQLHLPYLACITLLHMAKSSHSIPTAYTAAILSATCTSRIFEEFLVRGSLRGLQGMAGWYIAVALLALLHARRASGLQQAADAHIHVLRTALREMGKRWDSARMYDASIQKLLRTEERDQVTIAATQHDEVEIEDRSGGSYVGAAERHSHNAQQYFPGTSTDTSPLFEMLLPRDRQLPFAEPEPDHDYDLSYLLYDIFDNPFGGVDSNSMSGHLTGWGMGKDG
ncbi:hypothetical protein FE257_006914 [Aspergillus nanangensis]|uniref:Xylanolytic transcriptional activator regulatory domain-containing protein n=1 Tax=Aspergillus nanangensis TaxID=2582783 RepID=A0AAD4CNK5_ASPNN|nr:hypothetical protein FE257_006914 [Aspergillus nanangensis]